MASLIANNSFKIALFFFLFLINNMFVISVSFYQFQVGGDRGWIKPTGNENQTYNDWATENRFHVADTLYFKYQKDSVLVVNKEDYENCVLSNPISKFNDGNTIFRFDRYGFFYFISGQPGHCKAGQKLIVRVMVHPEVEPPKSATAPKAGGGTGGGSNDGDGWDSDDWGPPGINSTTKLSVASFFMTALGGVLVILYLFV